MSYEKLAHGMNKKEAARRLQEVMPSLDRSDHFKGSAPSVFIGSHSYPKVNTGVLSPQHPGNSSLLDSPKHWYKKKYGVEKVASLRTSLVNSKESVNVKESDNFLMNTREVAMARKPVDIEVSLKNRPGKNISGGRVKPVSASGDVEEFMLEENPSVERKIEKKFYDTDVRAETAVEELRRKGVGNYKIQQALSTGMLGQEENRKLVPTRWSITASDDMISKNIRSKVKDFQELGQIEYYRNSYVGNHFFIFLIPGKWEYELIELKRPGSTWNAAKNTYIPHEYEPYSGRTSYAEQTSGAYYAARLGALEYLRSRKRQAKVLIVRDVTPKYWAPLGVWIIRETVRNAFDEGEVLEEFEDIRWRLSNNLRFLYSRIEQKSKILGGRQYSLEDF